MQRLLHATSGEMAGRDIQNRLGLKHREHFRNAYLAPALSPSGRKREQDCYRPLRDRPDTSIARRPRKRGPPYKGGCVSLHGPPGREWPDGSKGALVSGVPRCRTTVRPSGVGAGGRVWVLTGEI
ncbi:MAG TPA: hypothetical protein VLX28_09020 [Thermoanaerobaculia bacterium]|nr:hypothetical protein [Thermoanaerobaculia bacterium]